MLQFIRSKAGSFYVKLLFVLLIGSFGIWGVGDVLRQKPADNALITVGDQSVRAAELQTEYHQTLDQFRRRFGGSLDADQARALGLLDKTVDRMVTQALFDQEAKRLNVRVGDQQIAASLADVPLFKTADGKVDRAKFALWLQNNRMTEQQFVNEQRGALAREEVGTAATDTPVASKQLVDTLYDIRNEKRVADYVFLPASGAKDLPVPDDAALQAYFDQHHDAYTAPEYRGFTVIFLQTPDVAAGVTVSEDEIKAAYDKRKDDDFHKPETRHVLQMVLPDEATAGKAEDAIAGGQDFQEVATTIAKQDPKTVDLGNVAKTELLGDIAPAVFDAKQGEVTKPIKSALGWHVLKVTAIEPEATKSYDEVKPQLQKELQADAERNALDKLSDTIQNALSGGADVTAIAQQYKLKPITIAAVDDAAKDPDGNPVASLPVQAAPIIKTVFDTNSGATSALEELKDGSGYYALTVDKITPPTLRAFDTVKDKVKDGWTAEQRRIKVAADGKALAEQVKPDQTLAKLAVAGKLDLRTSKPFTRTNERHEAPLPADVIAQLFKGEIGSVASGAAPDGFYVAQLKEIQPAKPGEDANATAQLKQQLQQELGNEMLEQFQLALRDRFPVDVRHAQIDQLLGGGTEQ
jgi:peptidyl-prolyl cis-trans isomerase D